MTDVVFEASGMLYDKLARTSRPVYMRMRGHAIAVPPPDGGVPPDLGIWPGPGDPDFPGGGGGNGKPPIDPGAHPSHPIALPGDPWWPKPPIDVPPLPPPGSPPVAIPGTQPINPIVPPPAIVVDYPGIGKVLVPQPVI